MRIFCLLIMILLSGCTTVDKGRNPTVILCGDAITTDVTLTADLNCNSADIFVVKADNIRIDGNGFAINVDASNGTNSAVLFDMSGRSGVTLENLTINATSSTGLSDDDLYGVLLSGSSNSTFINLSFVATNVNRNGLIRMLSNNYGNDFHGLNYTGTNAQTSNAGALLRTAGSGNDNNNFSNLNSLNARQSSYFYGIENVLKNSIFISKTLSSGDGLVTMRGTGNLVTNILVENNSNATNVYGFAIIEGPNIFEKSTFGGKPTGSSTFAFLETSFWGGNVLRDSIVQNADMGIQAPGLHVECTLFENNAVAFVASAGSSTVTKSNFIGNATIGSGASTPTSLSFIDGGATGSVDISIPSEGPVPCVSAAGFSKIN